jgi:hypothetical protein
MGKRDTMKPLRTAMYAILNNNLSYVRDGISTLVPCYDEKRKAIDSAPMLYVLFSTQQETPDPIDGTWITDSSIDLEITHRTDFEVTKDDLDNVSDQIYKLLEPMAGGNGFPAQELFQITMVRVANAVTRTFDLDFSGSQTVISKVITVTAKFVQQEIVPA